MDKISEKYFYTLFSFFLFGNLVSGVYQTPEIILEESLNRGHSLFTTKIGYGLGICIEFGVFLPLILTIFYMILGWLKRVKIHPVKSKIIYSLSVSLILNLLYGFVFIPIVMM